MRLHKLKHKYIIDVRGVCVRSANGPLMIMELLNGNLETYLERARNEMVPPISLCTAVRIMAQVAEAVEHLQKHEIVHRDLAARNVLMTFMSDISKADIKLADFGLARIIPHEEDTYKVQDSFLPVTLVPPEVFTTDEFRLKSDIWGFAVFAWEFLMVGTPPNHGKSAAQIRECVLSPYESVRCLPQPAACPDALYALLKMCWALDPEERPPFSAEQLACSNDSCPAIITILRITLSMLDRQSEEERVYLSPTIREEADRVLPLPYRPSDITYDDSGYDDSANTSRLSGQFDSVLTPCSRNSEHSEQAHTPGLRDHQFSSISTTSPTSPNYLVSRSSKLKQRLPSNASSTGSYEVPRTTQRRSRFRPPNLDLSATLQAREPEDTLPRATMAVSPVSSIVAHRGSIPDDLLPDTIAPTPEDKPDVETGEDTDPLPEPSAAAVAAEQPRYENWYYAQQTLKLSDKAPFDERLEEESRREIQTVSRAVAQKTRERSGSGSSQVLQLKDRTNVGDDFV